MKRTLALLLASAANAAGLAQDEPPTAAAEQEAPPVPFAGPRAGPFAEPGPDEPVAFWIHLDEEGIPSMAVTEEEWYGYVNYIRTIYPVADEVSFNYTVLNQILDRNLVMMTYHRNAQNVFRRAHNIVAKLKEGASWERMVRLHSEDEQAPSDGLYGGINRRLSRYPLESTVFEGKVGEIVGPIYTRWGAEIFLIDGHRGTPRSKDEQVVVKYILLKWGMPFSKVEWPQKRRAARLSTDNPRFKRILPPGKLREPPAHFGPADVAPIGEPDTVLVQYSCDDRFHDKRPTFSRPGDQPRKSDEASKDD